VKASHEGAGTEAEDKPHAEVGNESHKKQVEDKARGGRARRRLEEEAWGGRAGSRRGERAKNEA
jgi:hypothetical protein